MLETKQRTLNQNNALHLMFTQLASELTDHGLDVRKTLKQDFTIRWNPTLIKELIWRPLMKAQTGKKSTTKLTTKEIDMVFETINKFMAEKFMIEIQFPSIETIMMNERTDDKND